MQQTEISKPTEPTEKRPTSTTTTNSISPLCRDTCQVCNSGFLNEIHNWRRDLPLRELSEKIKFELKLDLSKDVLATHFTHYSKSLRQESTRKLLEKFDAQSETVSEHQKKTLFLAKISFDHIVDRIEAGTLLLGIEDFEKMVKLYYTVLRDPDSASDDNILAIFQRASSAMGCSLEQGILIKKPKPTE